MPENIYEDNNPFKVEKLKKPIAVSLAAIKLNFNDEGSVKFLSTCFEKNILANTCEVMESFEDYPFLCSTVASGGSILLMFEAHSKRIFLIPIDRDQQKRDINTSNIDSLIKPIELKLAKCKKNTNKSPNASILIVNGEKNYNKQALIDKLKKLGITNLALENFSPDNDENIGISVHFFAEQEEKSHLIKVKLFPFSSNLIYFPTYPKIPGPKKNPQQENFIEFSCKLDGSNISLQYDKKNYLNAITRYHTINPNSLRSTPIEKNWLKFLEQNQEQNRQKIFDAIFATIKEIYQEKNYDRILIGGEFCSDPKNNTCYGFFIHTIRGIIGEKTEFLDNQKIHECCIQSHKNLFSEAEKNSDQIYFMRQWFSKIGALPATEQERKDLLKEMMSFFNGKDFANDNILEGLVGVIKGLNTPIIKIKFDQFKDLDTEKLKEIELNKCIQENEKIDADDLMKYSEAILTESRLTKIKQYVFSENKGITNTLLWALDDIIQELIQDNCFEGVIKNNIEIIKKHLEEKIKAYLNKPSTPESSSSNSGFFTYKNETGTLSNLSEQQMEMSTLTKH